MPTIISHAVVALTLADLYAGREKMPGAYWTVAAVGSMLPDADTLGFRFGIHYGDFWGHRGFTHSLLVAGLLGMAAAWWLKGRLHGRKSWLSLSLFFFVVFASHGILDALTNGGLGIALFSPFNNTRYFFPWRPIRVSPIGLRFISARGMSVIRSELLWLWMPCAALLAAHRFYVRAASSVK